MKTSLLTAGLLLLFTRVELSCVAGEPGTVLWTFEAGAAITTSPVLANDGTVYIGTSTTLYGVTNSGSVASNRWAVPVTGEPAVGSDGTIYVVNAGVRLQALNPDSTLKWAFEGAGGSPAIGPDGTLYFEGSNSLYAVAGSGALKWRAAVPGTAKYASPAIGPDGTIYALSQEAGQLYAVTPGGTEKWARPSATPPAAAVGRDEAIYAGGYQLFAFSPDGTTLWSTDEHFPLGGVPSIGRDGVLYVASMGRWLTALSSGGSQLWNIPFYCPRYGKYTTPALDADGAIYFCVSNSLWAVTPQGQVRWAVLGAPHWLAGYDNANTSPAIGPDGIIYAAIGSRLYAVASGTNGPVGLPWPMYQQNSRHTGSIQKPALGPPKKRADANFDLQLFPQQVGLSYTIEASTNLNTWTSVTSIVATTFPVDFADLAATNSAVKFYRAFSSGP
jgi:large repetitive protein